MMMSIRRLFTAGLIAFASSSIAQSPPRNPPMQYGVNPTVGQWISYFQQKQDVLGFPPLNLAGGTLTGPLTTAGATINGAGFIISPGVAPTAAVNGAVWVTALGMYVRVAGVTIGPLAATSGNVFTVAQVINLNAALAPTALTGSLLQGVQADGISARYELDAFGAATHFTGMRFDGTSAARTQVLTGELVASWNGWAYNGAAVVGPISTIQIYAAENISAGHQGSKLCLGTTPTSSTTIADGLCQQPSGGITVGTPTGGDQGVGTVNAAGVYVAGAAVLTGNQSITLSGDVGGTGATTIATTIQSNAVTNAKMAQAGAATLKGNPTAGTANVSDFTVQGQTDISTPNATLDFVPIYNHTTGTIQKTTPQEISQFITPTPQGRLTLTSVTPVLTSTVSSAGTVYFTPYLGNLEPLWNGTTFISTACGEISNVLANSSTGNAGPAAAVASSVYDLFEWSNAGTCTLSRGPVWTNTTTRSAGTAVARVNGILVNSIAITNGPGAGTGTYVGTIATDGGGATVTWNRGASASGGTAAVLNVWNMYNRVSVGALVTDSGTTYTYTSATPRQARASAGNQISIVSGLAEDSVSASYMTWTRSAAVVGSSSQWGVGLDTTSAFSSASALLQTDVGVAINGAFPSVYIVSPLVGSHFLSANEASDGVNATTFNNNAISQLSAMFRM